MGGSFMYSHLTDATVPISSPVIPSEVIEAFDALMDKGWASWEQFFESELMAPHAGSEAFLRLLRNHKWSIIDEAFNEWIKASVITEGGKSQPRLQAAREQLQRLAVKPITSANGGPRKTNMSKEEIYKPSSHQSTPEQPMTVGEWNSPARVQSEWPGTTPMDVAFTPPVPPVHGHTKH